MRYGISKHLCVICFTGTPDGIFGFYWNYSGEKILGYEYAFKKKKKTFYTPKTT